MKLLKILISIVLLIWNANTTRTFAQRATKNDIDSLKHRYSPIINGVWVASDYVNSIKKTKSPIKSAHTLDGYAALHIKTNNLLDSIEVGASLNNHEGTLFTLFFIKGCCGKGLKTNIPDYDDEKNFYEIGYEQENGVIELILYHYDKNSLLLDSKKFTKIANRPQDEDLDWGIQVITNKSILDGKYIVQDKYNNKTLITFNSNGIVVGHPQFKTFYIFTDYLGAYKPTIEQICFNIDSKKEKTYGFKIKGDTFYLYDLTGSEENRNLKAGKLAYILTKQPTR